MTHTDQMAIDRMHWEAEQAEQIAEVEAAERAARDHAFFQWARYVRLRTKLTLTPEEKNELHALWAEIDHQIH